MINDGVENYISQIVRTLVAQAPPVVLKTFSQREEKIIRLIENFWVAEEFSDVMKFTLGKSYEEFDREWMRWLRKPSGFSTRGALTTSSW